MSLESPRTNAAALRGFALAAICSAVLFSGPALAVEDETSLGTQGATPATFVSFDGVKKLSAEATRVGMLSQVLTYTLTIGPDGKPTDCEFDRTFRRKYVEIALCRPLVKYHRFEPARDANGQPVEGRYSATLDFRMFFNANGSSNLRDY